MICSEITLADENAEKLFLFVLVPYEGRSKEDPAPTPITVGGESCDELLAFVKTSLPFSGFFGVLVELHQTADSGAVAY